MSTRPHAGAALVGAGIALAHGRLASDVEALAGTLRQAGVRVLATRMDNSPGWIVADRAARAAGIVHVPLPLFFTDDQCRHAIAASGADGLLAPREAAHAWSLPDIAPCAGAAAGHVLAALPGQRVGMPAAPAKVTCTSGTTGAPKGVCRGSDAMDQVTRGVVQALGPLHLRRHLCALPLAVLLENLAGADAALANGGECVVLPLAQLGWQGSSRFDPAVFDAAVRAHQPDSLILLPQMLVAWSRWLAAASQRAPASLRFVAVGGAAVGEPLLRAARAVGVPAYEGYGLSEGASAQTLNLPGADRPGSAGRPLPHARLRIAPDGEVEIGGALLAGYLGSADPVPAWWPTGDLGRIDADGFLHVVGRKKNVLVTSFGRNVSPEWVEGELAARPPVALAVVFGDGQPRLSAVLWPAAPGIADGQLQAAVDAANAGLPDYARVTRWVRARGEFSAASGLATPNGRPRRAAILQAHADVLAPASTTETP